MYSIIGRSKNPYKIPNNAIKINNYDDMWIIKENSKYPIIWAFSNNQLSSNNVMSQLAI